VLSLYSNKREAIRNFLLATTAMRRIAHERPLSSELPVFPLLADLRRMEDCDAQLSTVACPLRSWRRGRGFELYGGTCNDRGD